MNELSSIIISVVGALVVLIALPTGLGIAMHAYTRFPRVAMPALAAALALVPPLGLILVGRNLSIRNLSFDNQIDPGGLSAWLFRLTSASVIAIAVTAMLVYLMKRTRQDPAGRILLVGFIVYFVTNVVLNGLFGTVPSLVTAHLYALLVIAAVYVSRTFGIEQVLRALKWGLFLMMLGSLAFMVVTPQLVMQTNTPEVRLPFINFRFWGLGDGPNSTGPLGLMLFLITAYQPFRYSIVSLASMAAGLIVMVLAQSMTTWIAALAIIPPFLLVRYLTHPEKAADRRLSPFASIALVALGGTVALGAGALALDLNELQSSVSGFVGLARGQETAALSGRAGIWKVAVGVFLENPLFGYGPKAWDLAFRAKINMFFAFHAHNLFFQALSVGGLFGLAGTIFYVVAMGWQALKLTWFTRGLAPALFGMFMFRSISEVPLELSSILTGTFLMHFALFHVLCAGAWEMSRAKALAAEPETATTPQAPTGPNQPLPRRSPAAMPNLPIGPARNVRDDRLAQPVLQAPRSAPQTQQGETTLNRTSARAGTTEARDKLAAIAERPTGQVPASGQLAQGDPTTPGADTQPDQPPQRSQPNEPDQLGRIEPRLDI